MSTTTKQGDPHAMRRARALARDPSTDADQLRGLRADADPAFDRLLARHPNAPEDLLEILSHSSDRATRRQVCLNAAAPREALLRLAPQFPRDFIRNPVVDWLLIEEPDLLQQLGKGVLRNVLKHSGCPPSLIGWAVRGWRQLS